MRLVCCQPTCLLAPSRSSGRRGAIICQSIPERQLQNAFRRGLLLLGGAALAVEQAQLVLRADASVQQIASSNGTQPAMKAVEDGILAYSFQYPAIMASGKPLPLVFSRKPERYSSAAPLTADARQRIVCELADLIDAVTVSVTVGPPAGVLKGRAPEEWTPRQVAEQVLIDRSTARITTGQRVNLSNVEEAAAEEREGVLYYVYEHVSQGSPTLRSLSRETYRHALAVTAVRPGSDGSPFLYTLNMSCPQELWEELQPGFQRGIDSFRLLPPGPGYVAPDRDPWRFF